MKPRLLSNEEMDNVHQFTQHTSIWLRLHFWFQIAQINGYFKGQTNSPLKNYTKDNIAWYLFKWFSLLAISATLLGFSFGAAAPLVGLLLTWATSTTGLCTITGVTVVARVGLEKTNGFNISPKAYKDEPYQRNSGGWVFTVAICTSLIIIASLTVLASVLTAGILPAAVAAAAITAFLAIKLAPVIGLTVLSVFSAASALISTLFFARAAIQAKAIYDSDKQTKPLISPSTSGFFSEYSTSDDARSSASSITSFGSNASTFTSEDSTSDAARSSASSRTSFGSNASTFTIEYDETDGAQPTSNGSTPS
jgi:hypothetical protein